MSILHVIYGSLDLYRSLGYGENVAKKPSHMEMVTVQATAGMLAGACSSVITTPIDTVKTRLQVSKTNSFLYCPVQY